MRVCQGQGERVVWKCPSLIESNGKQNSWIRINAEKCTVYTKLVFLIKKTNKKKKRAFDLETMRETPDTKEKCRNVDKNIGKYWLDEKSKKMLIITKRRRIILAGKIKRYR